MTLAKIYDDEDFTYFTRTLWLPATKGLVGLWVLGGTEAESLKNRANPSIPLTKIGNPTFNANSVTIETGGGGYTDAGFETGIVPPGDMTIYAIRHAPLAGDMTILGASNFITGMTDYEIKPCAYNSQQAAPPNVAAVAMPTHGKFFLQTVDLPLGGNGVVRTYAAGVPTESVAVQAGNARGTDTLKIGLNNGAAHGRGNVALVALFNRLTTDAEKAAAYTTLLAAYDGSLVIA